MSIKIEEVLNDSECKEILSTWKITDRVSLEVNYPHIKYINSGFRKGIVSSYEDIVIHYIKLTNINPGINTLGRNYQTLRDVFVNGDSSGLIHKNLIGYISDSDINSYEDWWYIGTDFYVLTDQDVDLLYKRVLRRKSLENLRI